jgi:hypothetical protein
MERFNTILEHHLQIIRKEILDEIYPSYNGSRPTMIGPVLFFLEDPMTERLYLWTEIKWEEIQIKPWLEYEILKKSDPKTFFSLKNSDAYKNFINLIDNFQFPNTRLRHDLEAYSELIGLQLHVSISREILNDIKIAIDISSGRYEAILEVFNYFLQKDHSKYIEASTEHPKYLNDIPSKSQVRENTEEFFNYLEKNQNKPIIISEFIKKALKVFSNSAQETESSLLFNIFKRSSSEKVFHQERYQYQVVQIDKFIFYPFSNRLERLFYGGIENDGCVSLPYLYAIPIFVPDGCLRGQIIIVPFKEIYIEKIKSVVHKHLIDLHRIIPELFQRKITHDYFSDYAKKDMDVPDIIKKAIPYLINNNKLSITISRMNAENITSDCQYFHAQKKMEISFTIAITGYEDETYLLTISGCKWDEKCGMKIAHLIKEEIERIFWIISTSLKFQYGLLSKEELENAGKRWKSEKVYVMGNGKIQYFRIKLPELDKGRIDNTKEKREMLALFFVNIMMNILCETEKKGKIEESIKQNSTRGIKTLAYLFLKDSEEEINKKRPKVENYNTKNKETWSQAQNSFYGNVRTFSNDNIKDVWNAYFGPNGLFISDRGYYREIFNSIIKETDNERTQK